jgi:hypothetical protein
MKTLIRTRTARSLIVAPAALVLHIAAAAAANSPDDVLEQQRAILSGRVTMASHPAATHQEAGTRSEPLEMTRRVLSGVPVHPREQRRPEVREASRGHSEDGVQAWAQHVLAGHPYPAEKS